MHDPRVLPPHSHTRDTHPRGIGTRGASQGPLEYPTGLLVIREGGQGDLFRGGGEKERDLKLLRKKSYFFSISD